jgi:hypothetical protein
MWEDCGTEMLGKADAFFYLKWRGKLLPKRKLLLTFPTHEKGGNRFYIPFFNFPIFRRQNTRWPLLSPHLLKKKKL